jgi:cytoskeleton protein RodZ
MPEIGETLREARMRRRIDMTEVESATKIRGKYLRALENEEWDLLPGPTFVKTFLRTYAEYLGLDARLLVEEYRQRFERPSTQDLTPFRTTSARARGGGRRRRRLAHAGPILLGTGLVVLAVAFLYLLGTLGPDDEEAPPNRVGGEPTPTPTPAGERPREREREREREPSAPTVVRLQLIASGPVYVCVVDARGRQVIDEETLEEGTTTRTIRSQLFRTNFGNSSVRMRVNGKTYRVAESADPIGYVLRPGREPRRLTAEQRPDCSE